jgi:hypothetical protein
MEGEPLSRVEKVKRNIFRKRLNLVQGRDYNQIPVIAGRTKSNDPGSAIRRLTLMQNSEVPVAGHPAG